MSIPFGHNIDLNGNQILNVRAQVLATDPVSPSEGQYWFNSTDNVLRYYDGTSVITLAGSTAITALTGDVSATGPGSAAATVNSVGGASAANVADAVTKRHTQNTDTGTTSVTFQIDSANTGPKIKNNALTLEVRNAADNAYAPLKASNADFTGNVIVTGDLTVNGTTTTLNTSTMETGDNIILVNAEITGSAGNTTGGIAVKRFDSDNATRRDVQFVYNETTDRWEGSFGDEESAPATLQFAQKYSASFGDGVALTYAITHGLNTKDVTVEVYRVGAPYDTVYCDVERNSTTQVTLSFTVAPTTNQYRVVVTG